MMALDGFWHITFKLPCDVRKLTIFFPMDVSKYVRNPLEFCNKQNRKKNLNKNLKIYTLLIKDFW